MTQDRRECPTCGTAYLREVLCPDLFHSKDHDARIRELLIEADSLGSLIYFRHRSALPAELAERCLALSTAARKEYGGR